MTNKNRVMIIFAHPALRKSRVNIRLLKAAQKNKDITIHNLYEAYPEFDIDVPHEKSLMESHDIIVFQHPLFWYSAPAIIKEWIDLVLEHGWAYGSYGDALKGKKVIHAISTGGRESSYNPKGLNRYTIKDFLRPLEQTAYLCKMDFLPPFAVHGAHQMKESEIDNHADDYFKFITALRDNRIDFETALTMPRINKDLTKIIIDNKGDEYNA